ncbi:MAG: MgtC/SapB family protein [Actinobacteria bacterium]|nr:MgtC/SapB family protein [Actinomycetota bacterium]
MTDGELVLRVALALGLCTVIGLERELRQKSAGLRTHTIVGVGAAVAMMISKYGFADSLASDRVSLDPSRVASLVVSGVGFIGAGLIFVRGASVRGLTTAAVVWLSAMVGMAAGSGMYLLATVATAAHLVVAVVFPMLERFIPRTRWSPSQLSFTYADQKGVLREVLARITQYGYTVSDVDVDRASATAGHVHVSMQVIGRGSLSELTQHIESVDGIVTVTVRDRPGL